MTSNSSSLSSSERTLHQHIAINNSDMPWVKLTWLHYPQFCNNVLLSECLVTTPYVSWLKVTLPSSIWLPSFRKWCLRRVGGKSCHALLTNFEYCGSTPVRLEEEYETSVRTGGRHTSLEFQNLSLQPVRPVIRPDNCPINPPNNILTSANK